MIPFRSILYLSEIPMTSGKGDRSACEQRLHAVLEEAIRMYSDRLTDRRTDAANSEYQEVLRICSERAWNALRHRMKDRGLDEAAALASFLPQPLAGTDECSTNPLQDLVHVELFLRGHEPAVSVFLKRYRLMALKRALAFSGPQAARRPRGNNTDQDDLEAEKSEAVVEVAVQALLHEHRASIDKGTLGGLPGLDLRSFEGKTELFRWLCPSVTRLMGKLNALQRVNSFEELGTGTILQGSQSLQLVTGYFHETRHIGVTVRISGAGRDGRFHQTRLIYVRTRHAALTEVAAVTSVVVPARVVRVERRTRTGTLSAQTDVAATEPQPAPDRDHYQHCVNTVRRLLESAIRDAALSASEFWLVKYSLVTTNVALAKIRGIHPGNIGKQLDKAREKLKYAISTRLQGAANSDQECLELLFSGVNRRAFLVLLLQVLDQSTEAKVDERTPLHLLEAWQSLMRNLPKESQDEAENSPVADFISNVLRNSADCDGSIDAES